MAGSGGGGASTRPPNPRAAAGPLSVLFFWWTLPLFRRGGIKVKDETKAKGGGVCEVLKWDEARPLADGLEREWLREEAEAAREGRAPSLLRALRRTFLPSYAAYGILLLFHSCVVRVAYPLCLGGMVSYFGGGSSREAALGFAGGLVGAATLNVFLSHHYNLGTQALGVRIRVALSSLIYRKVLRLSCGGGAREAAGQAVNLLANDVARFEQLPMYLHHVWVMPLQTVIVAVCIWKAAGAPALIGVAALFLQTVPVQSFLSKLTSALRVRVAERTDERVRLMAEVVAGVQVVKMYAWEEAFNSLVREARRREIRVLLRAAYLRGVYLAFMVFSERSSLFFAVAAHALLVEPMAADAVFMLAQFFNVLQLSMAIFYPSAVQMAAEALVSIRRLQAFLLLEELRPAAGVFGGRAASECLGKKRTAQGGSGAESEALLGTANGAGAAIAGVEAGTVLVKDARARWLSSAISDTLCGVSFHLRPGTLCAVVGSVGAGKSSLLLSLLGELPLSTGRASVSGRVTYAAQEPWLFAATLRENVLFGRPWDSRRYRSVLRACALARDTQLLARGDLTPVGDQGAALSGGQRARVALARAVYQDADVYLLDDPLSAVDANVGKHLFDECICGLLAGKTRVLVTHQLQFLKDADHIIILNNGRVEAQGSYDELSRRSVDFSAVLGRGGSEESLVGAPGTIPSVPGVPGSPSSRRNRRRISLRKLSSSASETGEALDADGTAEWEGEGDVASDGEEGEALVSGPLQRALYAEYACAGSGACVLLGVVVLLLLGQMAASACDFFVTYWTNVEDTRRMEQAAAAAALSAAANGSAVWDNAPAVMATASTLWENATTAIANASAQWENETSTAVTSNDTAVFESVVPQRAEIPWLPPGTLGEGGGLTTHEALPVYGALVVACALLTTVRALAFFAAATRSARAMHDAAFAALLRAPMRFFDTNPAGRILNRFSKDVGAIDEMLPKYLLEATQVFLVMVSILVMVVIVNAWFLVAVAPLAVLFVKMRSGYLDTAQDLKRKEGVTKSPVFSHLSSSLAGLVTIRAAKAQERLSNDFDALQDCNTAYWELSLGAASAFGFVLDLLSLAFVSAVAFSFLIADDGTQGGWVGLAISQALILTGMVQHGVRLSADAAAQMTAVERVAQYSRLAPEAALETEPAHQPVAGWPRRGEVSFDHVCLRYGPADPPVLRDLSFFIEAGHKVGVVGRTGAGKSSLAAALFRLAPVEGCIRVDAALTLQLGLHTLRAAIACLPQRPVLFRHTLRFNLAPLGGVTDAQLWDALREVEMADAVEGLDMPVAEGGSNFSVGQRQLLCLARAILRDNKVLVLDEATANVDPQTDALIQTTIRRRFKHCTVLTVAHRLNTIMDSDKVLVMDAGQAVEYDHPHLLLQNEKGIFTALVEETGPTSAQHLRAIAQEAYDRHKTGSNSKQHQKKSE